MESKDWNSNPVEKANECFENFKSKNQELKFSEVIHKI
jgi:hypothetical protein